MSGEVSANNLNATLELNESIGNARWGASVWYLFTAPSTGKFIFDVVSGTSQPMSPIMGIGAGARPGFAIGDGATFTHNACPEVDADHLEIDAVVGNVYSVGVGGFNGAMGDFTLKWRKFSPPANDNYASAAHISGSTGTIQGSNVDATRETGESSGYAQLTTWYRWVCPWTGRYAFNTYGSDFDTTMEIGTGTTVAGYRLIGANGFNNDSTVPGSNGASAITFDAQRDVVYYIGLGAYGTHHSFQRHAVLNWARIRESIVQFSPSGYRVDEFAGRVWLKLMRYGAVGNAAGLQYTTTRTLGTAKAGINYQTTTGNIAFLPNQTTATFSVPIREEATAEGHPLYFKVTLINPGSLVLLGAAKEATVTILDDDAVGGSISFSAANYNITESTGKAVVTVYRYGATRLPVRVNYAVSNGLALAPGDFTLGSGTLSFPTGINKASFVVPIKRDAVSEPSESIKLRLSNPVGGATLGARDTATITILAN